MSGDAIDRTIAIATVILVALAWRFPRSTEPPWTLVQTGPLGWQVHRAAGLATLNVTVEVLGVDQARPAERRARLEPGEAISFIAPQAWGEHPMVHVVWNTKLAPWRHHWRHPLVRDPRFKRIKARARD